MSTLKMDNNHRINNLIVFKSTFSRHWTNILRHKSSQTYDYRSFRRSTNWVGKWVTDGMRYYRINNEE